MAEAQPLPNGTNGSSTVKQVATSGGITLTAIIALILGMIEPLKGDIADIQLSIKETGAVQSKVVESVAALHSELVEQRSIQRELSVKFRDFRTQLRRDLAKLDAVDDDLKDDLIDHRTDPQLHHAALQANAATLAALDARLSYTEQRMLLMSSQLMNQLRAMARVYEDPSRYGLQVEKPPPPRPKLTPGLSTFPLLK